MKTYEEMTESIIKKTEQRKKALLKKKRRLSLIAAVAAALILFTALPVGAVIINRRANQPAEITDPKATETAQSVKATEKQETPVTKIEGGPVTEYGVSIRELTSFNEDTEGKLFSSEPVEIMFWTSGGGVKSAEGGKWHYFEAFVLNNFTEDSDFYQSDIVVTDGTNELYHVTYNGIENVTGIFVNVYTECEIFIPDGMEYGEIYFYFNVLEHGAEPITDYDDAPFVTVCANFIQKYGLKKVEYGSHSPEFDRETLSEMFDQSMHNTVYDAVERLYMINEKIEHGLIPNDKEERDEMFSKRQRYIDLLTAYKKDNAEAYAEIIKEFCDNEAGETYDKNGNLIDKPHLRHDPLEDIAK